MKSRETSRAVSASPGLQRPFPPGGVILEYHRISKVVPDPHSLGVSPEHFSEHLEVLASRYTPTSLATMVDALGEGHIDPGSVAVTFDDGYADNLINAKPTLESHDIPAVFFVTSGYVDGQREFWWDELERCLLESASLAATLELETGGKVYRRHLGDAWVPTLEDESYWSWDLGVRKTPTPRHLAYRELHALLRPLDPARRENLLGDLRSTAGFEGKPARDDYRPLTSTELRELDGGALTEVGAHALTHAVLANLPLEDQGEEIKGGKEGLEEMLGRPIRWFSYPFGGKRDYSAATTEVVREAGFDAACASRPGRVLPSTDPYQLPRFFVYDWDGEHFERQMEKFFRQ